MRVLITGSAGFIGSNLAIALVERGDTVVGYDNLSQGQHSNLTSIVENPLFSLIEADVRDQQALVNAAEGCDVIVHLAAYKIPRYSDAYDTLMINALGSEYVAQAAIKHRCHIVAASTSDVYGKNPELPFRETSNLVIGNPNVKRWAYAISKMFEEQLLFACHDRYDIPVTLLRFFGGYGPHQHLTWWGGPQSVFINNALDREVIPLHGDGQQTRSFTYISDHIDGILRTLDNPAAHNEVFNIGSTEEITIEGLARLIWRLIHGDEVPQLTYVPYETMGNYEDVRRRIPDISKAQNLLQFQPQVTLEAGLKTTIRWQVALRSRQGIPTPTPYFEANP